MYGIPDNTLVDVPFYGWNAYRDDWVSADRGGIWTELYLRYGTNPDGTLRGPHGGTVYMNKAWNRLGEGDEPFPVDPVSGDYLLPGPLLIGRLDQGVRSIESATVVRTGVPGLEIDSFTPNADSLAAGMSATSAPAGAAGAAPNTGGLALLAAFAAFLWGRR